MMSETVRSGRQASWLKCETYRYIGTQRLYEVGKVRMWLEAAVNEVVVQRIWQ
jgi:hypothetical protein